jgi:hypothetical protein
MPAVVNKTSDFFGLMFLFPFTRSLWKYSGANPHLVPVAQNALANTCPTLPEIPYDAIFSFFSFSIHMTGL